ncbi:MULTISPECIES: phospho-N-acetylmuramoyl-pentapeptide-transferase [Aestuariimicrobium]|uniref:phospho-N-acetylmuramoyl-pentapeptide- transferase n=1 Tax=Aestuariimicrobium TaxID=396388 RepID=UPI0003B5D6CB|nr:MULTISPECIES: phospho-N-acetylmuramoyl-pentapeptide-transferase [Aestuariimicrobium]CAI9399454.1 Phospho-N-acetylmuramoyl-pentapeptide-transferase [Aestuariimicrobium sp. T2.26MG-19.2B]
MKNILLAGGLSMVGTLFGTRLLIQFLVSRGYGQFVRDDGPTTHHTKRGTPTMGGWAVIVSVIVSYFLAHLLTWTPITVSALLVLYLLLGMGFIGFLDDWTKIRQQRSLGLTPRGKLFGQVFVAGSFAVLALLPSEAPWAPFSLADDRGIEPASQAISFLRDINWLWLPFPLAVLWLMVLIAGASNASNLTDGLDGLLAGCSTMIFAAYAILNIWQFNQYCGFTSTAGPKCYDVRNPHDLAVVALALAGACFGFLWWNAKPAKIFIGDTGSLAIGGALAGLAIMSRTEFLLVIIAGIMVMETLSVILQVGWFKATKGKRLFKIAPFHHHFEMVGWQEVTVTIRFWIICGLCVAAGLGVFYAEWVVG